MLAVLVFALLLAATSASARTSCISDLGFELDECGIHRGPNEPPAHCGSITRGTGGNGWSERQGLRAKPEEKIVAAPSRSTSGVEAVSWGQVKHSLQAR